MTGQSGLPAVHEISARVTHLHFALLVPFICCATKFRQKLEIRDPLLELHGHVPIRAIMASALLWYAQRREGAFVCVCVCVCASVSVSVSVAQHMSPGGAVQDYVTECAIGCKPVPSRLQRTTHCTAGLPQELCQRSVRRLRRCCSFWSSCSQMPQSQAKTVPGSWLPFVLMAGKSHASRH